MDGIVLGQINLDIGVDGFENAMVERKESMVPPVRLYPGGDAQNAATSMARLGLDVCLLGRVGQDAAGDLCLARTTAAGVDCRHISRIHEGHTGTCVALIKEGKGEASFLYNAGENERFALEDIDFSLFQNVSFVSLHSLFALPGLDVRQVLEKARENNAFTFADTTNVHPGDSIDSIADLLPLLDVFAPSLAEISLLLQMDDPRQMAEGLMRRGVKNAVIKLGEQGCLVGNAQGIHFVPGFPADVVDTTGAGDNFSAALLYGKAKGHPLRHCARLGNAAGALTVGHQGASGAVQSAAHLEAFLEQAKE